MTLDPASASSSVDLSMKQKIMWWKSATQDLSEDPENHYGIVLGSEGFTAGCHFWEVIVPDGEGWALGVARKPLKGRVTLTPENGIWAVGKGKGKGRYKAFIKGNNPPLCLKAEPRLIRVYLNYNVGRVAFVDFYENFLFEFSGASFCGQTIYPFFAVYRGCLWISH